jgi:hypothetical protein
LRAEAASVLLFFLPRPTRRVFLWYNGDMTPELAQELKDAGFQQGKSDRFFDEDGLLLWRTSYAKTKTDCPTLSELVEACGEREFALLREIVFGVSGWKAIVYEPVTECGGTTPEEAVARLWLALNKK